MQSHYIITGDFGLESDGMKLIEDESVQVQEDSRESDRITWPPLTVKPQESPQSADPFVDFQVATEYGVTETQNLQLEQEDDPEKDPKPKETVHESHSLQNEQEPDVMVHPVQPQKDVGHGQEIADQVGQMKDTPDPAHHSSTLADGVASMQFK